jgi:hypothetical protein
VQLTQTVPDQWPKVALVVSLVDEKAKSAGLLKTPYRPSALSLRSSYAGHASA